MNEWTDQDIENYYKAHPEINPNSEKRARELYLDIIQKKRNKYHAQRTDGYPSKKHAEYAAQLALRQKAGEIWFWLEEVPFKLPGGTKHRVDFMVFYFGRYGQWKTWELVEVKGRDLPMGKLKRKQVEEIYGVHITVV